MSDDYLRLIPTEPAFVPNSLAQQEARALLSSLAPESDEIRIEVFDTIQFVDAGTNFEGIVCPACGQEVSVEWWQEAMDAAYETNFQNLTSVLPCCGSKLSLNDLNYTFPQGFSLFVLEAMNPNIPDLDDNATAELEKLLGCSLRKVWAHY